MTHSDTTQQLRDYLSGYCRHGAERLRAINALTHLTEDPSTLWREAAEAAIRAELRSLVEILSPAVLTDIALGRIQAAEVTREVL